MKTLGTHIRTIPADDNPLSADCFIIEGNEKYYVYDVGQNTETLNVLKSLDKPMQIILSHFHSDHCGNIEYLNHDHLYVGNYTFNKYHLGEVVMKKHIIDDGVHLCIQKCTSPHAKGSLIVTVDREYTLLGDLIYTNDKNGKHPQAVEMIRTLEKVDTKYFVIDHAENNVFEKETFIQDLKKEFSFDFKEMRNL